MKLFDFISVYYAESETDYLTPCLWCGSEKLSVSKDEGHVFQCWSCKERGNALSFMRKWYSLLPELSMSAARQFITLKKGVSPSILRSEGIKYDGVHFWLPVRNTKNDIIALHKFNTEDKIFYSSPKPWNCSILGMESLSGIEEVWVAEGHADYLIMRHNLSRIDGAPDLLGTCGSGFSGSYLHLLENKKVVLLFDNDKAGSDGITSIARRLKQSGHPIKSLYFLNWESITSPVRASIPDKYDIRDLYNDMAGVK